MTVVYLLAYTGAAALYLGYHATPRPVLGRMAQAALGLGLVLQLADIGMRCFHFEHPASSTAEATAFIAWLIAGGCLAASLLYRLHAAGAFAVPVTLVLLLLVRVMPSAEAVTGGLTPDAPAMGALGMTHVLLAALGVTSFALAAVIEVLYLLQEQRLRRKQLGQLRGGVSLDTLDKLAARCISIGFPLFTVALVTGALWVARLGLLREGSVRVEHVFAVASWLCFAVLIAARAGAGWQGRRAAWLTVGGFGGVMLVVLGYVVRYAG
jgi:ABC-type uncharacterized transport system permease subunit